jgi:predicted Zn-dependent protease
MRLFVLSLLLCLLIPLRAMAADPEAEIEKIIGQPLAEAFKAQYGVVKDPTVVAWVDRVGGQVAAQSPRQDVHYTFTIADTDIINAFSLPGGYIFVTRGLLDDVTSDDELAAVLGHEVGHETHYDAAKLVAASAALDLLNNNVIKPRTDVQSSLLDLADVIVTLSLSRHNEAMADQAGVDFSQKAGYDPTAFASFFDFEGGGGSRATEFLQTHPPDMDRIRRVRVRIATTLTASDWERIGDSLMEREEYSVASTAYAQAGDQAKSEGAAAEATQLPAPPAAQQTPYEASDRTRFQSRIEHARAGLRRVSETDRITSTLQQLLLFEFPTQDAASILVAAQALSAVESAESTFSQAAFVTRTSPRDWDDLQAYTNAAPGSLEAVNAAQAAGDLQNASQVVQSAPGPLRSAQDVLLAALVDLDSPAIRVHSSSARWTQYGVLEAAAISADTSIDQAEKNANKARAAVAAAQLRILKAQLDAYPTVDAYSAIAARQLNVSRDTLANVLAASAAGGQGGYGTSALLITLGAEAKQDPVLLAGERTKDQNASVVDMARDRGASLTSLATTLRMILQNFKGAKEAPTPVPSPAERRGVPSGNPIPASPK